MKALIATLFVAASLVSATLDLAHADSCNTTCTQMGGFTNCHTNCW